MLGDQIFEQQGKVTGRRVLDEDTIEISFDAKAKMKGVDGMDMGTYTTKMRPDGSMDGAGVGCMMTNDGQMLSWRGYGIGKFMPDGKIRFTGSVFYSTQSKGSLASVNSSVMVFEHVADMEGNITTKGWEWK